MQSIFNLTKENWGLPWHIILAVLGMKICFIGFYFIDRPYLWEILASIILVNLVGYFYEVYQRKGFIKRNGKSSQFPTLLHKFNIGTRQDLIANLIGSIIGAL